MPDKDEVPETGPQSLTCTKVAPGARTRGKMRTAHQMSTQSHRFVENGIIITCHCPNFTT